MPEMGARIFFAFGDEKQSSPKIVGWKTGTDNEFPPPVVQRFQKVDGRRKSEVSPHFPTRAFRFHETFKPVSSEAHRTETEGIAVWRGFERARFRCRVFP
jgi:hypothetical protein